MRISSKPNYMGGSVFSHMVHTAEGLDNYLDGISDDYHTFPDWTINQPRGLELIINAAYNAEIEHKVFYAGNDAAGNDLVFHVEQEEHNGGMTDLVQLWWRSKDGKESGYYVAHLESSIRGEHQPDEKLEVLTAAEVAELEPNTLVAQVNPAVENQDEYRVVNLYVYTGKRAHLVTHFNAIGLLPLMGHLYARKVQPRMETDYTNAEVQIELHTEAAHRDAVFVVLTKELLTRFFFDILDDMNNMPGGVDWDIIDTDWEEAKASRIYFDKE